MTALTLIGHPANLKYLWRWPVEPVAFRVSGNKQVVDELRHALLKEPKAKQLVIEEPAEFLSSSTRQLVAEALFVFAIHVPPALAAHLLHDWLRGWLAEKK